MEKETSASIPSVRHYSVRFVRYWELGDGALGMGHGALGIGQGRQGDTENDY
jgi:hypothetical protein